MNEIKIRREHGNSGDVIVSIPGFDPFHVPGDCTSYTALTTLRPLFEKLAAAAAPKSAEDVPSAPAYGGRTKHVDGLGASLMPGEEP